MTTTVIEKPDVVQRDEIDPTTGEPRCTHIVAGSGKYTGQELVMAARINGISVTALCGYTWVPERDPRAYPLCSKCKAIREEARPDEIPENIPHS